MNRELVFIFGTRPEAIKIAPVVRELERLEVPVRLVCTGQHTELLEGVPLAMEKVHSLGLKSDGKMFPWIQKAIEALVLRLPSEGGLVVVQGDTMSAYCGAMAASWARAELAHIEAGVRSHGPEPFPEEELRVAISEIADWHFAPTKRARDNLLKEGVLTSRVFLTGNPVVSNILGQQDLVSDPSERPLVLVTLHRRELTERPDLAKIVKQLTTTMEIYPEVEFVWPVHPRMAALAFVDRPKNLHLRPAMPQREFLHWLGRSWCVVTDSGGVVEEATTLGIPSVIFRTHNDRKEATDDGLGTQVTVNAAGAEMAVRIAATTPLHLRKVREVFGTKESAGRIAGKLQELLEREAQNGDG